MAARLGQSARSRARSQDTYLSDSEPESETDASDELGNSEDEEGSSEDEEMRGAFTSEEDEAASQQRRRRRPPSSLNSLRDLREELGTAAAQKWPAKLKRLTNEHVVGLQLDKLLDDSCRHRCVKIWLKDCGAATEPDFVKEIIAARKELLTNGDKTRKREYHDAFKSLLRGKERRPRGRRNRESNRYPLGATWVCLAALHAVLDMAERTVRRWFRNAEKFGVIGARVARPPHDALKAEFIELYYGEYIAKFADCQPDSRLRLVPAMPRRELYVQYVAWLKGALGEDTKRVPSQSHFSAVVRERFPDVRARKDKGISGKCVACDALEVALAAARARNEKHVQEQLLNLKTLHRQYYNGAERLEYGRRITEAIESNSEVLSIVMDGMDQERTRCPFLGRRGSLAWEGERVGQKLVGVRIHGEGQGHGLYFYRVSDEVKADTNLVVELLVRTLARLPKLPRKINLQVDGAPENRSLAFYACMAIFCGLGIVCEIWHCRCPVGHTHNDLDQVFGVLSRFIKIGKLALLCPLDLWRIMGMPGLGDSFCVHMEDIVCVHDWIKWSAPCLSKEAMSQYATGPDTQHVFRFQRPKRGEEPGKNAGGVKARYRQYAASEVFILEKAGSEGGTEGVGDLGLHRFNAYFKVPRWMPPSNAGAEPLVLVTELPEAAPSAAPYDTAAGKLLVSNIDKIVKRANGAKFGHHFTAEHITAWEQLRSEVTRRIEGEFTSAERADDAFDNLKGMAEQRAARAGGAAPTAAPKSLIAALPRVQQRETVVHAGFSMADRKRNMAAQRQEARLPAAEEKPRRNRAPARREKEGQPLVAQLPRLPVPPAPEAKNSEDRVSAASEEELPLPPGPGAEGEHGDDDSDREISPFEVNVNDLLLLRMASEEGTDWPRVERIGGKSFIVDDRFALCKVRALHDAETLQVQWMGCRAARGRTCFYKPFSLLLLADGSPYCEMQPLRAVMEKLSLKDFSSGAFGAQGRLLLAPAMQRLASNHAEYGFKHLSLAQQARLLQEEQLRQENGNSLAAASSTAEGGGLEA